MGVRGAPTRTGAASRPRGRPARPCGDPSGASDVLAALRVTDTCAACRRALRRQKGREGRGTSFAVAVAAHERVMRTAGAAAAQQVGLLVRAGRCEAAALAACGDALAAHAMVVAEGAARIAQRAGVLIRHAARDRARAAASRFAGTANGVGGHRLVPHTEGASATQRRSERVGIRRGEAAALAGAAGGVCRGHACASWPRTGASLREARTSLRAGGGHRSGCHYAAARPPRRCGPC